MSRPKYPDDFTPFEGKHLTDSEIDDLVAAIWDRPDTFGVGTGDTVVGKDLDLGLIHILRRVASFPLPEEREDVKMRRALNLGPRLLKIGDKVIGTCDELTVVIAEATDEEIRKLLEADEITLEEWR